ncbi:BMP family ABC transporter substrate-binding protein [Lederbergia citrea]|uniref:BMP family ABC transporter substrate-binding protein n=1 Tax=Lederbergia citrea TaxID=2833581 RepID=UPI003211BB7A
MLRKLSVAIIILFLLGCSNTSNPGKMERAGLLVPETINDQVWGTKGYQGLLKVQSEFGIDVFYKEGITSKAITEGAISEFSQKNVNLIFGHGEEYAEYFEQLASSYPDIHFVSFNGEANLPNTTSLSFDGYAMGFFGGMTAAHMSPNKKVGVIAAFEWQPEVQGFIKGAIIEEPETEVFVEYTQHWNDGEMALNLLDEMLLKGVDVIYPAGDGFNIPLIEKIKEKGLYAIGYVSDQSDLGQSTVLTSTVQHVDKLYELVAKKYAMGELEQGNQHFDFKDGVITMGEYSPLVDEEFKHSIQTYVHEYIETGKFPSEK